MGAAQCTSDALKTAPVLVHSSAPATPFYRKQPYVFTYAMKRQVTAVRGARFPVDEPDQHIRTVNSIKARRSFAYPRIHAVLSHSQALEVDRRFAELAANSSWYRVSDPANSGLHAALSSFCPRLPTLKLVVPMEMEKL